MIANILSRHEKITLHLVGGQVRAKTLAAVGPWSQRALKTIEVDVAFVGTNGLTVERGLTTPDLEESEVKRAIVAAARRVVVLTDHSKIGRNEFITFADINQVDTLVTDQASEPEILNELESQGVTVINA